MLTTRIFTVSAGIPADISDFIAETVQKNGGSGICTVWVDSDRATLISYSEDTRMDADLMDDMERAFPARGSYTSAADIELTGARIRCSVLGFSQSFPVCGGQVLLGVHQRIHIVSPAESCSVAVSVMMMDS